MSAALASEPPRRVRRTARPAPPEPRILNKRALCQEAGISRPTLDARIAADPHFPILRRGRANGDDWQFNADVALAHLARDLPRSEEDLSPNQQLVALKVRRLEREMAEEAGGLTRTEEVRSSLSRAFTVLRRDLTGTVPTKAAEVLDLTRDQQRLLRGLIEDGLRTFVAGLKATGLPDVE